MSDVSAQLFDRGKTYHDGNTIPSTPGVSEGILGNVRTFPNKKVPTGSGVNVRRTEGDVVCVAVRNSSGITLLPKRIVRWKSGKRGLEVDGYTTTTNAEAAGIVDDFLPTSGVPNGDIFWIVVKGQALVKTPLAGDAGNVFAEGDVIAALTAATSQAVTSGRPVALTLAATTHPASAFANYVGRAVSAKTTANTDADMLIDVHISK